MPDLLTLSERADYASAMQDLHDTFARNIVIYQTATKTVVSTNPHHNFLYGSGPAQTRTEEVVSKGVYKARIHYPKESTLEQLLRAGGSKNDDQINISRKDWKVKLVVDITIKPILDKCERIEFDGTLFSVNSDPRPHGVVGPQFWDYYLMALN